MSVLPNGWATAKFDSVAEVTDFVANGSFASLKENVQYRNEGYAVLVRLTDWKKKWSRQYVYISEESYKFLSKSSLLPGDIVISCVGEPGQVFQVPDLGMPTTLGPNSVRLRENSYALDKNFFAYYWKSSAGQGELASITTGTTQLKFNKTSLRSSTVLLPPLPEQKRIADKLDSVLARVDACRDRLDRLPALLKRFRQSILAAATSGKLTEDWRLNHATDTYSEKFSGLLNIQEKKREWLVQNAAHNEVSRVKNRLVSFEATSISNSQLPETWCWAALEDATLMVVDCHNKTAPYQSTGIPLVRTTNIRDGQFVWDDLRFVGEDTYRFWSKRCFPQPGDIVFTREAPMGEASIIPENTKICLGQRTMLIRPLSECTSANYLLIALLDPKFKERAFQTAVGTGVKHLRVGDVSELKLPLPPTNEQTEIVRRVDILFAFADRLEARLATARRQVGQLTPALLAKAFRGELVAQDPADEPAAELLKRLAAQREAAPKVKRGRVRG